MRKLMRELALFRTSPPEGLRVVSSDEDILDITGIIAGPGKCLPQSIIRSMLSRSTCWADLNDVASYVR